jgi:predicted kinase
VFAHFLVGISGSGKSTFAKFLASLLPNAVIVSSDAIRAQLYGDEQIQGNWIEIETEITTQIHQAIRGGYSVIYDATNSKRCWRLAWLQNFSSLEVEWVAWHLKTPLTLCQAWNRQRVRQVPESILAQMDRRLKQFPPIAAEGFAAVYPISLHPHPPNPQAILKKIQQIGRSQINSRNRTCHYSYHQYSKLIDFERLLYLISLLIRYPGLGNWQQDAPQQLAQILGSSHQEAFTTPVAEISAVMAQEYSQIYAEETALAADLEWLDINGFTGNAPAGAPLILTSIPGGNFTPHAYSDLEVFERLLKVIRFILRRPLLREPELGTQQTLLQAMQQQGLIVYNCLESLQKDIEKVLKPYKILQNSAYKQGYFAGTGIFSESELKKIFQLLQAQSIHFDDPLALETYRICRQRMLASRWLEPTEVYPVRAISSKSIVCLDDLPAASAVKHQDILETAILEGELLELNRLPGGGRYAGDTEDFFQVYPLQLMFHNIAWYLGYEEVGGEQDRLLRFERLDRLFLGRPLGKKRSRRAQELALRYLTKLTSASAGLFLGASAALQRQFLTGTPAEKAAIWVPVELWATERSFRFISEGTQRFGKIRAQMSPPLSNKPVKTQQTVFVLPPTGDPQFPHRFRTILPVWSLEDIEFKRWILGFAGQVKVVEPAHFVETIRQLGEAIAGNYRCC